MFELNSKTQVNRKFTMRELYKIVPADKAVKADAENILQVTLSNVLSEQTMNFTAKGAVKEIYVFEIVLKSKIIPALFISALDKAVDLHTVFIIRYVKEEKLYGAFKEYGEKGMKVGKYYFTDWTTERNIPLPLAASCLDDIYTAIIDELIPITARQTESTKDFVDRYGEVVKLKKEIEKLQHLVDIEKQPKRRFELNDELKRLKIGLTALTSEGN